MFACLYSPASAQEKLLALASSFSPLVENTARGLVIFSIVGLGKLIGTPQEIITAVARTGAAAGIQANLAVSADPDTGELLARHVPGITLVPPGREADSLSSLPILVLPTNPEIIETLSRWGIKTLGELTGLPELGFIARFGDEGTRILRLARGESQRALRVMEAPENYERFVDLDHPQRLLEPMLFVISSMLTELMEKLERNGLATNRVTLKLKMKPRLEKRTEHQRTIEFPVAIRDPKTILKQLQFDLEAHPPDRAILGVGVRLNPIEPRALQHGLFIPQAPQPEKLQLTLARLTALMGEGNVGSPELLDTYRRDAFVMRAFVPESTVPKVTVPVPFRFAFRYYRPAMPAQVRMRQESLAYVQARGYIDVRGEVVTVAGPWRASGDWWTESAWRRQEWDVELSDGGLYRICTQAAHWYVEGMYD
jgi:protein ImuB